MRSVRQIKFECSEEFYQRVMYERSTSGMSLKELAFAAFESYLSRAQERQSLEQKVLRFLRTLPLDKVIDIHRSLARDSKYYKSARINSSPRRNSRAAQDEPKVIE